VNVAAEASRPPGSVGPSPTGLTILALLCGWLVPGLGHILLRRVRRGLFFSALVLGSFALGVTHEGRVALRDERQAPFLSAMQVVANAGVGLADLAARHHVYGAVTYALPNDPGAPSYEAWLGILRDRTRSVASIYGTAYLWTAGLMNLLLLFDIWDIGRGRKQ